MECTFHLLLGNCIEALIIVTPQAYSCTGFRPSLIFLCATLDLGSRILLVSPEGVSLLLWSVSLFIFPIRIDKGWRITQPMFVSTCFNVSFSLPCLLPLQKWSRATLGKQSGMDSRQSVPEQKTDSKCL